MLWILPIEARGGECIDYREYLHLVGTLGTVDLWNVAVAGSYAYLACGLRGVEVIDNSTPEAPAIVGQISGIGETRGVVVSGDLAYVAAGRWGGIQILSVSDPAHPVVIGHVDTPDDAMGLALSGNHALIADNTALVVVDIEVPSSPFIIGQVALPAEASQVATNGDYAFIANGISGMQIVDVSNPNQPLIVGSAATPGYVSGVAVDGSLAFVADRIAGLQIIDISNVTAPTIIGEDATGLNINAVAVTGSQVYAVGDGGLHVFDVSDPTDPRRISLIGSAGPGNDLTIADGMVHVATRYCLEELGCYGSFLSFDVTNPMAPPILSQISGQTSGLTVSGEHAYLNGPQFRIFDMSDPAMPLLVGSLQTEGAVGRAAVSENYAYVPWSLGGGLKVLDVSNPEVPSIIGSVELPGSPQDVAVDGTIACVASLVGLQTVDVSDPASPVFAGSISTYFARRVAVREHHAFIADDDGGLKVVDFSNPKSPVIVGSVATHGAARDLALKGNHVYVASDPPGGLEVIDVASPTAPVVVAVMNTPGRPEGLAVVDNLAYLADILDLLIVDITIPEEPRVVVAAPHLARKVAASGALVYVMISGVTACQAQCVGPEAVTLSTLEATTHSEGIILRWSTSFEDDNLGFHVLRSPHPGKDYLRITSSLIGSPGPYEFLDSLAVAGTTYFYRLEAVDRSGRSQFFGPVSAQMPPADPEPAPPVRHHTSLGQSRPNPFSQEAEGARIPFELAWRTRTTLRVFNAVGRQVRLLLDEVLDEGVHDVTWDGLDDSGRPVGSGIYIYKLEAGGITRTRTLTRIR
jgi:hypothetical protein